MSKQLLVDRWTTALYRLDDKAVGGLHLNRATDKSANTGLTPTGVSIVAVSDMPFTKAGQFNGSSSNARYTTTVGDFDTGEVSVAAWARPTNPTKGSKQVLAGCISGADGFELGIDASDQLYFSVYDNSGVLTTAVYDVADLDTSIYQLFHGSYDGTRVRLYIGRVEVARVTAANPGDMAWTSAKPFAIGSNVGASGDWFEGYVAEVQVLSRARTPWEILNILKAQSNPAGGYALLSSARYVWNFDTDTDEIVEDDRSQNNGSCVGRGTVLGTDLVRVPGESPIGDVCYDFPGLSGKYLNIPYNAAFSLFTAGWTWDIWLMIRGAVPNQMVLYQPGTAGAQLALKENASGYLRVEMTHDDATYLYAEDVVPIYYDQLMHVTIVYEAFTLALLREGSGTSTSVDEGFDPGTAEGTNDVLVGTDGGSNHLDGRIYALRFHSSAMTLDKVLNYHVGYNLTEEN